MVSLGLEEDGCSIVDHDGRRLGNKQWKVWYKQSGARGYQKQVGGRGRCVKLKTVTEIR